MAKPADKLQEQAKDIYEKVNAAVGSGSAENLPEWNCQLQTSPSNEQWTVGELFTMSCSGPNAEFLSTNLQFDQKAKDKAYQIRILEVSEQSENSLTLQATTYNPGNHQMEELYIMDQGKPVVKVKPFTLPVKSVITKQPAQSYGPIMAMKMAYPVWLWGVLFAVVVAGVSFVIFRMRRRSQMRKVFEELQQHNTALGAFNQFNKDLRLLGRQYIFGKGTEWEESKKVRYVESLDEIFRMYVLREFFVPALDWNTNLVVRTISKKDRKRYPAYGESLRKFLKELDRAKNDTNKLKNHDCKQLTQMAKRVSQSIWRVRKEK